MALKTFSALRRLTAGALLRWRAHGCSMIYFLMLKEIVFLKADSGALMRCYAHGVWQGASDRSTAGASTSKGLNLYIITICVLNNPPPQERRSVGAVVRRSVIEMTPEGFTPILLSQH